MSAFLSGMEVMAFLVAALLFFRFWRKTRDVLFMAFGAAFCLFALNQFLVTLLGVGDEAGGVAFIPRLLGFALLMTAIIVKTVDR
jgi:hypothetical protein